MQAPQVTRCASTEIFDCWTDEGISPSVCRQAAKCNLFIYVQQSQQNVLGVYGLVRHMPHKAEISLLPAYLSPVLEA